MIPALIISFSLLALISAEHFADICAGRKATQELPGIHGAVGGGIKECAAILGGSGAHSVWVENDARAISFDAKGYFGRQLRDEGPDHWEDFCSWPDPSHNLQVEEFDANTIDDTFVAYRRENDKPTFPAGMQCVPVSSDKLGECKHDQRQFYNVDGYCISAGDNGKEETNDQRCKRHNPQSQINEMGTACRCTDDPYLERMHPTTSCQCMASAPFAQSQGKCVRTLRFAKRGGLHAPRRGAVNSSISV